MGTHIIDAFLVTFGLDSENFRRGEREVNEATQRLRQNNKRTFDEMEERGAHAAEAFKKVRNEVIGLGLAFMGASSITGLVTGMLNGAAAADRMGERIGMTTKAIWAWRQAAKANGGQIGEGDSALQTIQNARMGWQMSGSTGNDAAYWRLGITGNDLRDKDPGEILKKIAAMQGKMNPQLYASLLQQIGLPNSIISFLQQGQGSVEKLIKQFEKDAKGQEEAAKQAEKLQETVAKMQATLTEKLVPALTKIADILDRWLGGAAFDQSKKPQGIFDGIPYTIGNIWNAITGNGSAGGGPALGPSSAGGAWATGGGRGRTRADRNNNPGNIVDGHFARSQPGYVGSDGRFARFSSPMAGAKAMEALIVSYMRRGRDTISSIISRWAPASENNTGAYIAHVEQMTGIARNQHISRNQVGAIAAAMAKHEGYGGGGGTHHYHIRSTDPKAAAQEIHRIQRGHRRHAVAQADRGVAP